MKKETLYTKTYNAAKTSQREKFMMINAYLKRKISISSHTSKN